MRRRWLTPVKTEAPESEEDASASEELTQQG
jgi:hypothetical protein